MSAEIRLGIGIEKLTKAWNKTSLAPRQLQSRVNCLRKDRRLVENTARVGDLVKEDRAVAQIVTQQVDGITIVDVPRYTMLASSHVQVYTELREVVAERIANGRKKIVFNLGQSGPFVPSALAS